VKNTNAHSVIHVHLKHHIFCTLDAYAVHKLMKDGHVRQVSMDYVKLRPFAAQGGRVPRWGPRGTRPTGSAKSFPAPRVSEPNLVPTREGVLNIFLLFFFVFCFFNSLKYY